ncbi:MAG: hypothetical protein WC205_19100 [Opitutaceae bacterium]|jgi:hypothetical protein
MKTTRLTLAILITATVPAFAGPLGGGGGTRKANAQARLENHTQGQNLSAQQQANVQKLQSDLTTIKAGSTVTDTQKQAVKDSLSAIADGAVKPSEESVTALADSLSTALAEQSVSPQEKATIVKNVQAVLTSANISQAEVENLVASTQDLLVASGVTKEDAQTVATDLRAIGTELKTNAAIAKTATQEKASAFRAKLDAAKTARGSGN